MGIILQLFILCSLCGMAFMGKPQGLQWLLPAFAAACAVTDALLWLKRRAGDKKLREQSDALFAEGAPAREGDVAERAEYCFSHLHDAEQVVAEDAEAIKDMRAMAEELKTRLASVEEEKKKLHNKSERGAMVLHKAHTVCSNLSTEVRDLASLVVEVSKGVESQRASLTDTSRAMEEVSQAAFESSTRVQELSESAQRSSASAATGEREVEGALSSIEKLKDIIVQLKTAMAGLGEKASNIGHVMAVINEVADQTNLLALNAAIEAARAGDAGRGFAVVADEVRKLAEKTMASTHDVGAAITSIQASTAKSMTAMETATEQVSQATEFAHQSGQALEEIVSTVEATADQVNAIAAASEQQSVASEEINRSISTVNDVVQQTAEAMHEAALAVNDLARQAQNLSSLIGDMKK